MLIQTLKLPSAGFACGGKTELSLKSMRVETFKALKLPNLHQFSPACGHGLIRWMVDVDGGGWWVVLEGGRPVGHTRLAGNIFHMDLSLPSVRLSVSKVPVSSGGATATPPLHLCMFEPALHLHK
jgi:hypothetical protein